MIHYLYNLPIFPKNIISHNPPVVIISVRTWVRKGSGPFSMESCCFSCFCLCFLMKFLLFVLFEENKNFAWKWEFLSNQKRRALEQTCISLGMQMTKGKEGFRFLGPSKNPQFVASSFLRGCWGSCHCLTDFYCSGCCAFCYRFGFSVRSLLEITFWVYLKPNLTSPRNTR